ncbi:hypothetical protein Pelo_12952 [Pelomyxa schiedti]|nr:hypothetical protein Pelo_12952 [Pelomyxa schiedti]
MPCRTVSGSLCASLGGCSFCETTGTCNPLEDNECPECASFNSTSCTLSPEFSEVTCPACTALSVDLCGNYTGCKLCQDEAKCRLRADACDTCVDHDLRPEECASLLGCGVPISEAVYGVIVSKNVKIQRCIPASSVATHIISRNASHWDALECALCSSLVSPYYCSTSPGCACLIHRVPSLPACPYRLQAAVQATVAQFLFYSVTPRSDISTTVSQPSSSSSTVVTSINSESSSERTSPLSSGSDSSVSSSPTSTSPSVEIPSSHSSLSSSSSSILDNSILVTTPLVPMTLCFGVFCIGGIPQPPIVIIRGNVYVFSLGIYPVLYGNLIITNSTSGGTGATALGRASYNGQLTVEVDENTPSTLYYQSDKITGIGNAIQITTICGDGNSIGEQCDDGNTRDKDGCTSNCTIEAGYGCTSFITSDGGEMSECVTCDIGGIEPESDCTDKGCMQCSSTLRCISMVGSECQSCSEQDESECSTFPGCTWCTDLSICAETDRCRSTSESQSSSSTSETESLPTSTSIQSLAGSNSVQEADAPPWAIIVLAFICGICGAAACVLCGLGVAWRRSKQQKKKLREEETMNLELRDLPRPAFKY